MKLTDLDADFLRVPSPGRWQHVKTLAEAQGVIFLCPKCFATNRGPIGTHMVVCWFKDRGVPPEERPAPARWTVVSGTGLADLTLNPSILLTGEGCKWHGWIRSGNAR